METFSALLAIFEGNSPAPGNSPHVNNGEAGDLRRYRAHYDVIVMLFLVPEKMIADDTRKTWPKHSKA